MTAAADRPVLVLVRDVLGAALMGALVETEGWTAVFPRDGERPEAAVHRLRPAVVLADGYHAAVRSDLFHAAARQCGSRLLLFAPAAPWGELESAIRGCDHVTLVAPAEGESLGALIRAALRAALRD